MQNSLIKALDLRSNRRVIQTPLLVTFYTYVPHLCSVSILSKNWISLLSKTVDKPWARK